MNAPVLLIAIGNTRIKAMICDRTFIRDCRERDFSNHIIATYAYTHDQIAELIKHLDHQSFSLISIASVVPDLKTPWHDLPHTQIITTVDVPLEGLYRSMGCDRALAAFGAGELYGYPILVIDAGTAITLTAIDPYKKLIGGAIMAGLRSQFAMLHENPAALPMLMAPENLPNRWAIDTNSAIQTGIAHILLMGLQAYIDEWRSQYPQGKVIMTGGDADYFQKWGLVIDVVDPNLIFWGMIKVL
jgi:type III pantothenate kinase